MLFAIASDIINALLSQLKVFLCPSAHSAGEETLQFSNRNVIMTDWSGEGEGLLGGWKPITADEEDWRGLKWAPLLTGKMMHGWQQWHPYCVSWLQNWCSIFPLFMVAESNQTIRCSLTFLAFFFFIIISCVFCRRRCLSHSHCSSRQTKQGMHAWPKRYTSLAPKVKSNR